MKRVLVFILLKLAEISGVIVTYLVLSKLGYFLNSFITDGYDPVLWYNFLYFWIGIIAIFIVAFLGIIIFAIKKLIPGWIKSNWDLAGRITNK